MVNCIPVVFTDNNKIGDLYWMINQPEYSDCLFLFSDNEIQFRQFISFKRYKLPIPCIPGGGNSNIRPFQCEDFQRAMGIPTCNQHGGFQDISTCKGLLKAAFIYIRNLLKCNKYKKIIYNVSHDQKRFLTSQFQPSESVNAYILSQINSL